MSTQSWSLLLNALLNDEAGFIVSAEMVLIGTITVLGMVVGLSEVAFNVNKELGDVATAFGSVNQSYWYNGSQNGQGQTSGSYGGDSGSYGDVIGDVAPTPESY